MKRIFAFFLLTYCFPAWSQEVVFHSWEELSRFVQAHSITEQVGQKQLDLAALTEKAAIANVSNPRIPLTGSAINNTHLPVSFIPAEAFGGPSGSFREITLGQPYITSFTATPQFDVINLAKWQEVKTAKANTEMVAAEIAVNKKRTLEQVNALFCNALLYQEQIQIITRFVQMADSIASIMENKQQQGIARVQEVNDARVNLIQQQLLLRNVQSAYETQLRTLSGICQKEVAFQIENDTITFENKAVSMGNAELKKAMMQYQYASLNQRAAFYDQLPILSFQSSLAYQNNSNQKWADPNNRWIYSSFVGLKITWDFPTNAVKYTNVRSKKINTEILALQLEDEKRNTAIRNQQATADYQKSLADLQSAKQILQLEADSYMHTQELFEKDLISMEKLLLSQKKWLASAMECASTKTNTLFQKNKISINNAD